MKRWWSQRILRFCQRALGSIQLPNYPIARIYLYTWVLAAPLHHILWSNVEQGLKDPYHLFSETEKHQAATIFGFSVALPHLQAEQRVQKNPGQLAGKQPRSRQSSPNRSRSPCTPRRASPQAGSDGNFMKFHQRSPRWTFVLLQAHESCLGESQVELPSAMIYRYQGVSFGIPWSLLIHFTIMKTSGKGIDPSLLIKDCRYHTMNRLPVNTNV